jgi:hypothetical protein
MSEVGSHNPFGHFKHKLWSKEGAGVKLPIWLSTTKSWELPRLPSVKVAYDIPLESSWRGIQLFFKHDLSRRSSDKVMGPQKLQESQLWEFLDSHLGVPRQNVIWVLVPWPCIQYTIKGKVVASPKFGPWWVLWVRVYPWLVLAPNVFQLCTNQLVVWFCADLWEWFIAYHFSESHPEASACPFTPKSAASHGAHPNSFSFHCHQFWTRIGSIRGCISYIQAFKQSTLYIQYLRGGPTSCGFDRNELLLKRAQWSNNPTKLTIVMENYTSGSSF